MRVTGSEDIYGFSASALCGVSPRVSLSCCVASGFYICIYGFSASALCGVSPRVSLSCCVASGFYICKYSAVLRTCFSCGGFLLGCAGNWDSAVSR